MNILRTRTRRGAAILFSGVLVLGGLALTSEASAVKNLDDNPTCEYLGFTYGEKWDNEPSAGVYTLNRDGMEASLTVGTYPDKPEPNENNAIIEYSISLADGYAIVVKGGDGATVYHPGAAIPLHAPAVGELQKWPTISHFDLCWNKPAPEPEVGSLQVTKVVTGEGAPTDATFTVCIKGPAPATTTDCKPVTTATPVTFENLVPGTYEVTEPDPGTGYTAKITPTEPVEVIAGDIPTTVTVTNTYTAPPAPPPTEDEVAPPTQEALPPTAPTTPPAPVTPAAPAAPAEVSAQVPAQTALPATGSEGGLAAVAAILVTTGVGLTLLGKRRGTQQA